MTGLPNSSSSRQLLGQLMLFGLNNTDIFESVTRDADIAEEITKFIRNQIMMESSTVMLVQAN